MTKHCARWRPPSGRRVLRLLWRGARTILVFAAALGPAAPPPPPPPVKIKEDDGDAALDEKP